MIEYPYKRVFALIGPPRAGKNEVAKYLQESRNFVSLAFADKIKEEYGISKEDFEAAKITGEIDRLRQELWDFSAKKKEKDPNYFIKLVMDEAINQKSSVVITDVRTKDEFNAINKYTPPGIITKIYLIENTYSSFKYNMLIGSKLSEYFICDAINNNQITTIYNNRSKGLYMFSRKLEKIFFKEDMMDLSSPSDLSESDKQTHKIWRTMISDYISQFDIQEHI